MKINFTVHGKAVAQPRPRFTKRGHVYMPKRIVEWKKRVLRDAWCRKEPLPHLPLRGALAMTLAFYLPKPKSTPRKVRYPVVKPDGDNYEKPIMDALEGECYSNDSQIVDCHWLKVYCTPENMRDPHVEIQIIELEH